MAEHQQSSSKPLASPSDQDNRLQFLEHFDDIFKCTICLGKPEDPHLCPRCSKLYCYGCVSEWLLSESEEHINCPNCKLELQLDNLVKVRWFEEAEKLHRSILEPTVTTSSNATTEARDSNGATAKKDICTKHLRDINFYCCTCKLCVCDKCAVVDEQHLEHTFKSLDVIYDINLQIAHEEFEKVIHHTNKIASLVEKVERNVELVKKVKEEKLTEIRSNAESAIEELEGQVNAELQKLQGHKDALMAEMQDIEESLKVIKGEVLASSRPQLIAKKSRISKECNKICMNPIKDFNEIRVPVSLKIKIPFIYETRNFVIENFSTFGDNNQNYSNEFTDNYDHIWRIKAHWMSGQFGIYLTLVKGLPCWMECRFQLIHPDAKRIINKEFKQHFERPENGWGYKEFVALKTIREKNYLKDDSLELLYHIRPCSGSSQVAALLKGG